MNRPARFSRGGLLGSRCRSPPALLDCPATVRAFPLLLTLIALVAPAAAEGAALVPIGTYSSPLYVTSDPDDPDRLFVVERDGKIQLTTPSGTSTYLDITDLVRSGGEQGLLSVAFPPDHADSGLLYVFYTGEPEGNIQVDEFRAVGDSVDPATRRPVLQIDHATFGNHNGGQLQFGPNGLLYIATGDGGGGGDPLESGQDLTSLLGKILRIDPRKSGSDPHSIPSGNPFAGSANDPVPGARDEIWSYGLRNPWRFSFDRLSADIAIGDVGQGSWEEVDYVTSADGGGRGANFGWDCREGAHDFELAGCDGQTFTEPVFEYSHDSGNCSITGGYVVRDPGLGDLYGRYLYADFCVGALRSLLPGVPVASDDRSEGLTVANPTTFGEDACGRIYVASINGGVSRLEGDGGGECVTRTVTVGLSGSGAGRVTGPGIDCPGDCSQQLFDSEQVELNAQASAGSLFAGWSGDCAGASKCELTTTADRTVDAAFEAQSTDTSVTEVKQSTSLSLVPATRRARRGDRVRVDVVGTPCPGRAGDQVTLLKDGRTIDYLRPISRAELDGRCGVSFRPRLRHTTIFGASISEDETHLAAEADPVRIRVRRRGAQPR